MLRWCVEEDEVVDQVKPVGQFVGQVVAVAGGEAPSVEKVPSFRVAVTDSVNPVGETEDGAVGRMP